MDSQICINLKKVHY